MAEKNLENEENKRTQNYIIVGVIFLVMIGFVLYLCKVYRINEEEQRKIPIIRGYISEIYNDDLEHYIMDNPTAVLYVCTANDDSCRSFEKNFKKLLKKYDYEDEIVYLNLTDLDQDAFVSEFNTKYHYKIELTTHYPAFILFEDGSVKSILQGSAKKPLTITNVKHFLELNEIGE